MLDGPRQRVRLRARRSARAVERRRARANLSRARLRPPSPITPKVHQVTAPDGADAQQVRRRASRP